MSVNYTEPGSGTAIAADLAGGYQFQQIKLVDGTAGGTGAIGGDATNGLDVDVTRVIPGTSATHLGKAEDAAHTSADTGVMALAVRKDVPTALAGTDADYAPLEVDAIGRAHVRTASPSASLSNVSASITSVTILAANSARVGACIYNDSANALYAKFGATASVTSFTNLIGSNSYYEVPFGYTGIIDGIWLVAAGTARVTEVS